MTYEEYLSRALDRRVLGLERAGQAHFNVLHDVRPELADRVQGGAYDPFYDDNRLTVFLHWVQANW